MPGRPGGTEKNCWVGVCSNHTGHLTGFKNPDLLNGSSDFHVKIRLKKHSNIRLVRCFLNSGPVLFLGIKIAQKKKKKKKITEKPISQLEIDDH